MLSEPPTSNPMNSLYRSEAFAEDLFEPGEAPRRARRRLSAVLRRGLYGLMGLFALAALLLYSWS